MPPPRLPDHPKFSVDSGGTLLLNFGRYGQEVEVACFSGNGERVLTVKDIGVAQVWATSSGEAVGEIRPSSPLEGSLNAAPTSGPFQVFIEAAALNMAGDLALLGLNDGTAGVFTVGDGRRLCVLHRPAARPHERWEMIRAVDWSVDGSMVAVGFQGGVGIWTPDGRPIAHLEPPAQLCAPGPDDFRPDLVTAVSLSADGRQVFAGFANAAVVVWDLASGRALMTAAEHAWDIIRVQFAGDRLLWATSGGTVWSAAPSPPSKILHTGQRWSCAAFSPDGESVLVRCQGGSVSRWSLRRTETAETVLSGPFGDSFRAAMVGGHRQEPVGFWGDAGTFHFADDFDSMTLETPAGRRRFQRASRKPGAELDLTPRLDALCLSPAKDRAVTTGWSPAAELWNARTGELVARLEGGPGAVAFAPDGGLLALGTLGQGGPGQVREILMIDPETGRVSATLGRHRHQVLGLAFGPDGRWMMSAGLDRKICRWEKRGWRGWRCTSEIEVPDLDPYTVAVLADGRCLVFRDGSIEVRGRIDRVDAVISCGRHFRRQWSVSPDLERLAVTTGSGAVSVYRLADGRCESTLQPTFERPFAVPDRSIDDATALATLWRAPGGPYVYTGDGPRGWATPLTLSADRRLVVIPCRERAVVLMAEPEGAVVAQAPFAGRLRGARITPERVLLVNQEGRVFTAPVDVVRRRGQASMTREELVKVVRRIVEADGSELELDELLALVERSVPHPAVSDLIFHPPDGGALSPEQVVDAALGYRPLEGSQ